MDSIFSAGLGPVGYPWFLTTIVAAIAYFQFDYMNPESLPIDTPTELLMSSYDFIVVGAGSAGKFF